ncbi:hypothetical protein CesoFtcFv8_019659 [Champsocephalus esox]|uniref:Uncharacterized protein n=1 Tax=Champsocephalus esox TaxID=159716 RepID=A0AAN8BF23_9TELE|nr:hypothetical protein CesoFtcFv8_019659 [Champsocephalus esox]
MVGCFSCWAMSSSPAPPRHAADHLPKLVPRVRAKACSIGPALRHTVPSCSRWCQALNPAADVTYSDKRESHQ